MRERPILFSGEMVRAILSGKKTQTRRPVKNEHIDDIECWANAGGAFWEFGVYGGLGCPASMGSTRCPFGAVGDRLYVRETWRCEVTPEGIEGVVYRADGEFIATEGDAKSVGDWHWALRKEGRWRPSMHMPRWASRITLEITDVRVQRVKDISEEDSVSEGFEAGTLHWVDSWDEELKGVVTTIYRDEERIPKNEPGRHVLNIKTQHTTAANRFASAWNQCYGAVAWGRNSWVWAVSFKRVNQ